jgi:hypothetical protein
MVIGELVEVASTAANQPGGPRIWVTDVVLACMSRVLSKERADMNLQTPLALSGRGAIKRRASLADISEFTYWMIVRSTVEFVVPERGEGAVVGTHSTTMSSDHENSNHDFLASTLSNRATNRGQISN